MTIEKHFDIPFIAGQALREKQIQQNYRPIIAVHKWFARRPGTLYRGLLLAEFLDAPLVESFFSSNDLSNLHIADPFMGGGTPLLEANRLGCQVTGFDINPMSYWIVKQEIEELDLLEYRKEAAGLRKHLASHVGDLYKTTCTECGNVNAEVKYFLWVKCYPCRSCDYEFPLFPGYLVAQDRRHTCNVYVCPDCGKLNNSDARNTPEKCLYCDGRFKVDYLARKGRCKCPKCHADSVTTKNLTTPLKHKLFALEYHCSSCRALHKGRYFKSPDATDLDRVKQAARTLTKMRLRLVPDDQIPKGDESTRLHRWGYKEYKELFNERQLVGLELSARYIQRVSNERIRNALATNLSDLLRYQNMLCRYDSMALKSLDVFSVHGFPVGLIQCESNLLGIENPMRNTSIGSGGWTNIIDKYHKAKSYCDAPFETRIVGGKKRIEYCSEEWIGDVPNGYPHRKKRNVKILCQDSSKSQLTPNSLDAVLTDPPYFGNVQYAELMDFCYVWLRKLVGEGAESFSELSTRNISELTGNEDMGRTIAHFAEGLSRIYQKMSVALKPGAPLAFTYHHNDIEAYVAVVIAILDSGLVCSASIPCPAEMGASIHINGTGSSILVDRLVQCPKNGLQVRQWNSPRSSMPI